MTTMNRRDVCAALSLLPAFAALAAVPAEARTAVTAAQALPGETVLATPHAYPFDQLPVAKNANGESRAVVRGALPTGEAVELHETTLLPGHSPHPPHQHRHSEFMMVREGTLEFDSGGKQERVGPGGVIFAASDIMHGVKNVGETTANYFVIAIGRELPVQTA